MITFNMQIKGERNIKKSLPNIRHLKAHLEQDDFHIGAS